jgi:hypothetical protein
MDQEFWIAGQRVTRQALATDNVAHIQKLLKHDHDHGVWPTCLCTERRPQMVIRKLASRYVLARKAGSGPDHHPQCDSYLSPEAWSGRSSYTRKAIEAFDDGTIHIRLDEPLAPRKTRLATRPARKVDASDRQSVKRDSTTLLGVLNYFWDHAGLNRWSPRMRDEKGHLKRGWWTVERLAKKWAALTHVGRESLAGVLFTPPPFDKAQREQQCTQFRSFMRHRLGDPEGAPRHALLLAELDELKPTQYGAKAELKHLKEFSFWLSAAVLTQLERRFARELSVLNTAPPVDDADAAETIVGAYRIIGLFRVAAAKRPDQFQVLDAGLMRVTPEWIPVQSQFEAWLAQELVAQKRYFQKPLRYDASEESVFPDFLLSDCGDKPLPLEVFGYTNNPAYESRKAEKIAEYRRRGEPFWYWDVAIHGNKPNDWPGLPLPVAKRAPPNVFAHSCAVAPENGAFSFRRSTISR